MTTLTLRERRHQQAIKDLERLTRQRETMIDRLTRITARLKLTRRAIDRYERTLKLTAVASSSLPPAATANVEPPAPPPSAPASGSLTRIGDLPVTGSIAATDGLVEHVAQQLGIPPFLRRSVGDERDAAAREAIAAEQAERKRAKALGRAARRTAQKAGDLAKMPLSGKAALARIRGE